MELTNVAADQKLAKAISVNLKTPGAANKVADTIGESLNDLEKQLLAEYSKPTIDEGKISSLQVRYKKAERVFEAFQAFMRSAHERMIRVIQNIRTS
jgi:hypothetical protein